MKKIVKLALIAAVALPAVTFVGCKKGENDPAVSLRSRKGRVAGEWKVSSVEGTSNEAGVITTTTYDGTTWTETTTGNDPETSQRTINYTFEKDGTFTGKETKIETESFTIGSQTYTTTVTTNSDMEGTWNFTGGVGEMKNKSQIVLMTNKISVTQTTASTGNPTETDSYVVTYTGNDAPTAMFNIDQLKNKEMIWKTEGSTTSSSTYTEDMTWVLTQE